MQYRLVYDVLKDGPPWFGAAFAIFLLILAVACFLETVVRVRGKPSSPVHVTGRANHEVLPFAVVIALFLLMGGVGVFLASYTCAAFVQRKHCQEWIQAGQCQITEGVVADY